MGKKVKKSVKKMWDFISTLIVSVFLLVLAVSVATGALNLQAIGWLSWIPLIVSKIVGWVFIIAVLVNVATSIWNLFTK